MVSKERRLDNFRFKDDTFGKQLYQLTCWYRENAIRQVPDVYICRVVYLVHRIIFRRLPTRAKLG